MTVLIPIPSGFVLMYITDCELQNQHYPPVKVTWEEWHLKIQRVCPRFKNKTTFLQTIDEKKPEKFVIIRHPFHRLLSAYISKFEKYHVSTFII